MWREAAQRCCREHLLVHTMRSARDPPAVLGTVCRALGETALRTIWLAPQHDATLTHRVRNKDHCGCTLVTKNIHTHACLHAPGELCSGTLCCVCACELNTHEPEHTSSRCMSRGDAVWAHSVSQTYSFPLILKTHTRKGRSKSLCNNKPQSRNPCRQVSHLKVDPFFPPPILLRFELWSVVATPTAPPIPSDKYPPWI